MSRYVRQLTCRFHPEATLIEDYRAGDMICGECGLVVGDRMVDVGSEWRTFSNDSDSKDMSRVGAAENSLFDGTDLETNMSLGTGAAALDEFGKQKYRNGPRQVSSSDKALRSGYDAIRRMAGRIDLSARIIHRAFTLFKQCYENKCVRGRPEDAIVATCIYIACRQENAQRTLKEICAISATASKRDIGRCFNRIIKTLTDSNRPESIEIKNIVPRFCSQLELTTNENMIKKAAVYVAERAKEICDVQGRAPESIAGASIYMACAAAGEKKQMKSIQDVTGVTENTIRLVYKIMLPKAVELFPSDFSFACLPANLPQS